MSNLACNISNLALNMSNLLEKQQNLTNWDYHTAMGRYKNFNTKKSQTITINLQASSIQKKKTQKNPEIENEDTKLTRKITDFTKKSLY